VTEPHIQITDGPYLVSGEVALVRRRKVVSEHGEPMTWQTTTRLPSDQVVSLCRCGGSGDKPFCDGTHNKNGFAQSRGAQTAAAAGYAQRATAMGGGGVVVRDDRSLCVHAGFCSNKVTNVWKVARGGGADDSVARTAMIAAIEHCPSGALTFRLTEDGPDVEPELAVQIGVSDDGPLLVTGRIPITRSDGTTDEVRDRVALCRCGESANKPYCDGTHAKVGFSDS
jgi:CDGSH-type Zn-finger protein/ferredoxin